MNTAMLLIGAVALLSGLKPGPKTSGAYDDLFRKYADNPRLAKAVSMVESSLNPGAIGDNGRAFGLMQIWLSTAQGHGYSGGGYGLLDPETNIYWATRELNHLVSKYGFSRGIMGYNIGETRLRKGGSNHEYFQKVLTQYGRVKV
jgi:soluble lytic murein transglycosylase-like protein